jgi:hypothetical protein
MDEVTGPCLMFVRPHTMIIPRPESVEKMNGREAKVKLRKSWCREWVATAHDCCSLRREQVIIG